MNNVNLETIIRNGRITDLTSLIKFKFDNGLTLLTAVVGIRVKQKDRGIREKRLHWYWKAYSIRNMVDYELISEAVSAGIFKRIVFMYINENDKWLLKYDGFFKVDHRDSLDEQETTPDLILRMREKLYYGTNKAAISSPAERL